MVTDVERIMMASENAVKMTRYIKAYFEVLQKIGLGAMPSVWKDFQSKSLKVVDGDLCWTGEIQWHTEGLWFWKTRKFELVFECFRGSAGTSRSVCYAKIDLVFGTVKRLPYVRCEEEYVPVIYASMDALHRELCSYGTLKYSFLPFVAVL